MIITKKFVLLNYPKTGSSFVRKQLKRIHRDSNFNHRVITFFKKEKPFTEILIPSIDIYDRPIKEFAKNQHGKFRQIPEAHKGKIIVSVIRNPFDRIVSQFTYGWYKKKHLVSKEIILEQFPTFPNFTFSEYLSYSNQLVFNQILGGLELKADIGLQTLQFILYFFEDPKTFLENLEDITIDSNAFKKELPKIHFLHTENLNSELYEFLLSVGYKKEELVFIKSEKKENISMSRAGKSWKDYISQEEYEEILYKERLLFKIFPEYLGL